MTSTSHTGHRREDDRLVTGRGQFTDDVHHAGALNAVFVRSAFPCALIRSIDASAALAIPGVVAVLTGADMAAEGFDACPKPFKLPQGDGSFAVETPRPLLPSDRARCVGEPVVMVIADSYDAALNAAEQVMVDYEEQESVTEVAAARDPGAPQVWAERPGNLAYHWRAGDDAKVRAALASSHHVARLTSKITRVAATPLEPRSALGYIGADGRPVLHLSHQSPHQIRDDIADMFKRDRSSVRVITSDVGGSFGMKVGPQREEILVLWAAMRLQRPVRWTASRSESFLSDEHARDVIVTHELGLDAGGRFTALRVQYEVNVGAYMSSRSTTPISNIGGIAGVYTTPAIAAQAIGIFTNTQTTAAYRGAGRPDATYAIERIIDVAAAETGVDPAELRRRNLIPTEAMPYKTSFLFEYDCGEFERNLDKALELARYDSFSQRREAAKRRGLLRGIGIAMPIERAGTYGGDRATLRANLDGTVTLTVGSKSVGQGHESAFPQVVANAIGIPAEQVHYEAGDTDQLPTGRGNGGSSALIQGGSAVKLASEDFVKKGREASARKLEAHVADIEFVKGVFRVKGTDQQVHLSELAREGEVLMGAGEFTPPKPTYPNGCHICEVEIDPATGEVKPINYVSVEDVGRVLNHALVEGQIHGGVAQGIGQALMEQIRYDEYGQLVSGSFMDYALPRADDLPEIVSATMETITALNPLGAKGVGEAGTVGALSATINAVCNALLPAGILHLDMPATPMRVWQALQDRKP